MAKAPEEPPAEEPAAAAPEAEHHVEVARPAYDPAPVPNQDATGPAGPSEEGGGSVGPSVIQRPKQFQGSAFSAGDSVQNNQTRNQKPALGLSLHVPTD